jgi:ComF family protein
MGPRLPWLRRVVERGAALLAPDVCAACDAPVGVFTVFCSSCAATLEPCRGTRPNELAAYTYGGALVAAVTSLKYEGRVDRARPLSHLLRRSLAPLRSDPPTLVIPVPLHPAKLVQRGFNHAALLALPVARDLGVAFAPLAVVRIRDTAAQARLGRGERLTNVHGAFAAGRQLEGERVLLVDDVRTTGATLDACAAAAREAGALDVRTLTLAVRDD